MRPYDAAMPEGLRDIDANLLLPLYALLQERNLTHAGDRIALSQPAMSGALVRLRKHFGDDLLVRTGHGFELTPLAERLSPLVAEAVEAAGTLLGGPRVFDPATASKRFTVGISEYAMTVLSEPLTRLLRVQGPGCSVAFDAVAASPRQYEQQLMSRDLIVAPLHFDLPGHSHPVFTDELVCVVARANPRLRDGALTLDDLKAMPHAVAEFPPVPAGHQPRPIEAELRRNDVDRSVLVQVTNSLALLYAVAGTGMCAFVPRRLARRCLAMLGLAIAETPLRPVRITEAAHWHARRSDDPAGVWLRQLLYDVAVEIEVQDDG